MKLYLVLLLLLSFCRTNPPCSVLDSTCNVLGYLLPDIIQRAIRPQSSSSTTSTTFPISANGGPKDIILTWTAQTGATSYRIFRKTSTGVTNADTDITNGGTTNLTFTDRNVSTNDLRYYRVAYRREGRDVFSNEVSANVNTTGLALYLRADSISQTDNTAVAAWNDESGNDYHATQGGVPDQPRFRTNVLNGLPVIRFNGSSHFLERDIPSPNLTNGTNRYNQTNFLVFKRNLVSAKQFIFIMKETLPGTCTASNQLYFEASANDGFAHGSSCKFNAMLTESITSITDFFIISLRAKNDIATNYSAFSYQNGKLIFKVSQFGADKIYDTGSQLFRIGRNIDTADPDKYFNGDLAEFIHYNRMLTEAEHAQIVCSLSSKYNIPVTEVSCSR